MNYTTTSSGVTYTVTSVPSRLVIGDSTTDYCVNLTSASATIPWSAFSNTCWNTTGTHLSGPPSSLTSVRFQVVADTTYGENTQFDFCVTQLSI